MHDLNLGQQQWQKLEELFHEASAISDVAERTQYLEVACGDDENLKQELVRLLACDTARPLTAGELVRAEAARVDTGGHLPAAGSQVGPYRIVREIGRGGSSVVYLGERNDGEFCRNVAIKLLKPELESGTLLEKFQRERRILASLDHPFISRIIDAGVTEDLRSFLVMEYVEGHPLDEYCRQTGLTTAARCELVEKVGEAMSAAHRGLVVHRDLKPGNILVDADGTPHVLDFGIAKVLENEQAEQTETQTISMTPAYAAPEQILGHPVGTGADIYSLGVILFEVLTGRRPVRGPEVEKASDVESSVCPASQLRGDLDRIIAKAIQPLPEDRYHSVERFTQDLKRWRAGLPVSVGEGGSLYRLRKFLNRHKVPVFLGVLAAVMLSVGLIQTLRAARAGTLAERRLAQVRELAGTITTDLSDELATLPGSVPARRKLVETGMKYYDSLLLQSDDNTTILREAAGGYDRLGDILGAPGRPNLGDAVGARQAYDKAAAIRKRINDPSPDFQAEKLMELVRIAGVRQRDKSANHELRAATEAAATSLNTAASEALQAALFEAWIELGDLNSVWGESDDLTLQNYVRALEIATAMKHSGETDRLARVQFKLGGAMTARGRGDEAALHFAAAMKWYKGALTRFGPNPQMVNALGQATIGLVQAVTFPSGFQTMQEAEITATIRESEDILGRQVVLDGANVQGLHTFADVLAAHIEWLLNIGKAEAAVAKLSEMRAAVSRLFEVKRAAKDSAYGIRFTIVAAEALIDAGRLNEAKRELEEAVRSCRRKELGPDERMMCMYVQGTSGRLELGRRNCNQAERLFRSTLEAMGPLTAFEVNVGYVVLERTITQTRLAQAQACGGNRTAAQALASATASVWDSYSANYTLPPKLHKLQVAARTLSRLR